MKHIKIIAAIAALGLAAGGYAVVQVHHGMRLHGMHEMDGATLAGHLSKAYGQFAAFDLNKDGQLDAAEKASLAKAIADGSLSLPAPTPPKEAFPSEEQRLSHFAEMYAKFAVYDSNHDGVMDAAEQAAVQAAVESGQIKFMNGDSHAHALGQALHAR